MAAGLAVAAVLIASANLKLLPFGPLEVLILFGLAVLFSAYRPGWSFLLLVLLLPLETVNLAPAAWGIEVRPYQALSGAIGLGLLARLLGRRLPLPVPRWQTLDTLWIILLAGTFVGSFFAPVPAAALKQACILTAAVLLYAVARYFVRDASALPRILPFFVAGTVIAAVYALWQNARFQAGLPHFEMMPGRPNATFAEADWLGAYLALGVTAGMALLGRALPGWRLQPGRLLALGLWLVLLTMALILTVARSAWLGTAAGLAVVLGCLGMAYWRSRTTDDRRAFFGASLAAVTILLLALGLVSLFRLTDFQLGQRAGSIAGEQTITLSCVPNTDVPERIARMDELSALGCRHINLEDVGREQADGRLVTTTLRPDPNVSIRKAIYAESWALALAHPLTGIGLGESGRFLGSDERGARLNSSNYFLEFWLGGGALALVASLFAWGYVFRMTVRAYRQAEDGRFRTLGLALLGSGAALLVFNLFNAGVLQGFLFVWFAMSAPLWIRSNSRL